MNIDTLKSNLEAASLFPKAAFYLGRKALGRMIMGFPEREERQFKEVKDE